MSSGVVIPWEQAYDLAKHCAERLRPVASRVKAAGSLRRFRPQVGDIEFVIEPRLGPPNLLGEREPEIAPIRAVVEKLGRWLKGGDRYMAATDLLGDYGRRLDIWLVHPPAQWGSILAIRTGPADLGRLVMTRMKAKGLRHVDGFVYNPSTALTIDTPEEDDFFRLADLPCWAPRWRDELLQRLQTGENIGRYHVEPTR
jgi:DNA polymerase/3'-5' exonuclease PolX